MKDNRIILGLLSWWFGDNTDHRQAPTTGKKYFAGEE